MTEALLEPPVPPPQAARQRPRVGHAGGSRAPASAMRSALGMREGGEEIAEALAELERMGISGRAAGAWIRALEEATASSAEARSRLVGTGGAGRPRP